MDFSEKSQACLSFLENNPSSYRMFERLVLQDQVLTMDEFFRGHEALRTKLSSLGIRKELVDRLVGFRAFDKIRFEDRDVVLFAKYDRDVLLDSVVSLREMYNQHHFGVFGDRLEEELAFWDMIVKKLKDERAYLYGNSLDGKEVATEKPGFIGPKDEDLADDPLDKFHLDFVDVDANEKNERYVKVGHQDTSALIQKINSQSATILWKGINPKIVKVQQQTPHKAQPDFREFEIFGKTGRGNSQSDRRDVIEKGLQEDRLAVHMSVNRQRGNQMEIEQTTPREHTELNVRKSAQPANDHRKSEQSGGVTSSEFVSHYQNMVAEVQATLSRRLEEGPPPEFFRPPKQERLVVALNNGRTDNISLGDPRSAYVESDFLPPFEQRYRDWNAVAAKLMGKVFRLFPLETESERLMRDKLVKDIQQLSNQVDSYLAEIKKELKTEDYKRHHAPLRYLRERLRETIEMVSV